MDYMICPFLRAEREADGRRTFKLVEGEPLQTSYGEDLYNSIFGVGTDNPKARAKKGSRNGDSPSVSPLMFHIDNGREYEMGFSSEKSN
jgi:hypothetical protein